LDRDLRQEVQKRMKPHWLLAKGMGTEQELTRMIADAVITHVLLPLDESLPRTQVEFDQRLERRGELFMFADELLVQLVEWLKIRHRVLKSLRGAVSMDKAMAFSDTKAHMERLVAPGFLSAAPWERLKCYARYLKGMDFRIEKLQGNLPRDRQSMLEFESLFNPWMEALKRDEPEKRAVLEEFRWLLEEFRVSLFAQPLGTKEPVSLKRLNKKWQEIIHFES
jgi:ATP-dependent helicase HrpA